jgi:hypothetical protein
MSAVEHAKAAAQRWWNHRHGAVPRPAGTTGVVSDLDMLVPAFRVRVEAVIADMQAQGFDAKVFETWRSPERVQLLLARGTGSARSFHPLGCAADIISDQYMWFAGKHATKAPRGLGARFWAALELAAESRGLTHGAGKTRVDLPHVQALPHWWYPNLIVMTPAQIERAVAEHLDAFDSALARAGRST